MDNISNLSSNLPPTRPVNNQTLNEIDRELNQEFRDAANAVASLYKLSLQKKTLLKHQGYLDCLNDLLNVIKNDGDIETWALSKRMELDGNTPHQEQEQQQPHLAQKSQQTVNNQCQPIDHISEDTKFTISYPIDHKFIPTKPLLSVNYSANKQSHLKRNQIMIPTNISSVENQLPVYDMSQYSNHDMKDDENTSVVMIGHNSSIKRSMERTDFEKRQKLDQH